MFSGFSNRWLSIWESLTSPKMQAQQPEYVSGKTSSCEEAPHPTHILSGLKKKKKMKIMQTSHVGYWHYDLLPLECCVILYI